MITTTRSESMWNGILFMKLRLLCKIESRYLTCLIKF
jgi:hypothetical protein